MKNALNNLYAALCFAGLFGGLICSVWMMFEPGPLKALGMIMGLPVFFVFGNLIDEDTTHESD